MTITAHYTDEAVRLYHGDCIEVMRQLPDASVDAVVTDPPYGLEFMGKEWDSFAPQGRVNAARWNGRRESREGWQEDAAARSGKGGGGPSYGAKRHTFKRCTICGKRSFSGSPCICPEPDWIVESPEGAPTQMLAFQTWCTEWATEALRVLKPGGHLLAFGGTRTWHRLACAIEDAGFEVRDSIAWMYGSGFPKSLDVSKAMDKAAGVTFTESPAEGVGFMNADGKDGYNVTKNRLTRDGQSTPLAQKWQGWGTALKPAFEPVVVARKPLIGTVAENVLRHGTGALNVDGGRVGTTVETWPASRCYGGDPSEVAFTKTNGGVQRAQATGDAPAGRWPANVILDESQAQALDRQSGEASYNPAGVFGKQRGNANDGASVPYSARKDGDGIYGYGDRGGASRFFYTAKADSSERPRVDGVAHPTVKPLDLMRYLVRLVTPPGGVVLEPFAGSGTTAEACIVEGFRCIAIEREADYIPLIMARITKPIEVTLL